MRWYTSTSSTADRSTNYGNQYTYTGTYYWLTSEKEKEKEDTEKAKEHHLPDELFEI